MSDEGYNGWRNYPTWAVNLWLANDEGLYRATVEMTQQTIERADEDPTAHPYWTPEETRRYDVADMLKDWVTDELAPDLGASFATDLLGYAFSEVDWSEIADAWIETAGDQVTA